jgi:hypothetical protein
VLLTAVGVGCATVLPCMFVYMYAARELAKIERRIYNLPQRSAQDDLKVAKHHMQKRAARPDQRSCLAGVRDQFL